MERVVITGIGPVTSIGVGHQKFWRNLLEGKNGIGPVTAFDTSAYRVHRGGEIADFRLDQVLPDHDPKGLGRATRFALAAAALALADAALDPGKIDPNSATVVMGTTSGEPNQIERFNDHRVSGDLEAVGAQFAAVYPCHKMPRTVAATFGFLGEAPLMIPAACAAGNYALAHGFDAVRDGRAQVVLAGGADAFSRITYTGFARLMAIDPDVPRPFDLNRRGMVPGEGACFLVLESLSHARARGASIWAELAGYGLSCDAYHMTGAHPEGIGAVRSMNTALAQSAMLPGDISYISAHGTGTLSNDRNETTALKKVFGKWASRIPISSIKSMLGHTMGAASAIESAVCAMAIRTGWIPPTATLETPDPDCDLDYVPARARRHQVSVAMNNAYAFGGANASLIFKVFEG